MNYSIIKRRAALTMAALGLSLLVGCQSQSKNAANQDIGRAIPAASLQRSPSLSDLTGGDLGVGGGFLIAAAREKVHEHQHQEAIAAAHRAEQLPAQLQQVRLATTADLNNDGFVTLDEILAMFHAGLSRQEIGNRLQATHYIFQMTPEQERYLTDRGVTPDIITTLQNLQNRPSLATEPL